MSSEKIKIFFKSYGKQIYKYTLMGLIFAKFSPREMFEKFLFAIKEENRPKKNQLLKLFLLFHEIKSSRN